MHPQEKCDHEHQNQYQARPGNPVRQGARVDSGHDGLDRVGVNFAAGHRLVVEAGQHPRIRRKMPVRGADVVGRDDHRASLELFHFRIVERVRLEQPVHRHGQHASRGADEADAPTFTLARKAFAGKCPAVGVTVATRRPQGKLHGQADPRELLVGNDHRVKGAHQFVVVREVVGDTRVVGAIGHHQQMLRWRAHDFHVALRRLNQLRDQDLVSLRQLTTKRRVVIARNLAVRQLELAQPGLGADGIDEVQTDRLDAGVGKVLHRHREYRLPERQWIVLVLQQGVIVHGDYSGMLRIAPLAGDLMPVVVEDVLVILQPAQALAAERYHQRQHRHGKKLPDLAEPFPGHPLRTKHAYPSRIAQADVGLPPPVTTGGLRRILPILGLE